MNRNPASVEWIAVPPELNRDYVETHGSITFKLSIAPQNIPIAVRAYRDRETARFVLEFRYYGHEDRERTTIEDGIVITTGVSTGRLFTIEIPVRLAKELTKDSTRTHDLTELLAAKISESMNRLRDNDLYTRKNVSREYFRLTSDIVSGSKKRLFAAL